MRHGVVSAAIIAAAVSCVSVSAQAQAFHKGERVLITPFGGTWEQCTLTSDPQGHTGYWSYSAKCDPPDRSSPVDPREHLFSEERVKPLNDPTANAAYQAQNPTAPPRPFSAGNPTGAAVPPAQTDFANQVFHKGEQVLIAPYSGEWLKCTLTSDAQGYTNNWSYNATCEGNDPRQHLYSAERIRPINDPTANAQYAQYHPNNPPPNAAAAAGPAQPIPANQPRVAPPAAKPPAPAPQQVAAAKPPAPPAPQAAPAGGYKVGDKVAMPAGFDGKYLQAVITEIDPNNKTFPYKVHPLGYTPYADGHYNDQQLKPYGSVPMQPIGGIVDDPYLLAAQGKKAFQPTQMYAANYECVTLTDNQLVSAALINFTVLNDHQYRDAAGEIGTYQLNPQTGAVNFLSGGLFGQPAIYRQPSNPPVKSAPPQLNLTNSTDTCDAQIK